MIKAQRKNPFSIPIIIINFNQLYYLKQLIDFLLKRGFENIVIIDNKSTYPPLLEYYKEIKDQVHIEFMKENAGHMVFFENKFLQKKYGKGYYVLTDADIVPNENLPENFMSIMINDLDRYFKRVTKVGFALRIDDLIDNFPLKSKVIEWESRYWRNPIEKDKFLVGIDTTFALYKPYYPSKFKNLEFKNGLRLSNMFTAKHGGWYKDIYNLTEEEKFYQQNASKSSSWNFNEEGEMFFKRYE
ncbi:glycosyltransferase family 2 protein [Empedobacter falsenii]